MGQRLDRVLDRLGEWLVHQYPRALSTYTLDMRAYVADAVDEARRRGGLTRVASVIAMVAGDVARTRWRGARFDLTAGGHAAPTPGRPRPPSWSQVMEQLVRDVWQTARRLARTPAFTLAAVLTLALAIGATTAVFTVVDQSMLRPLPYPDAARMMVLSERNGRGQSMSVSWLNFQDWAAQNATFSELGVYRTVSITLTGVDRAERLNGSVVSASVFATTGIRPLAGRVFNASHDQPSTPSVVIISERLWQSRLGSRPDAVGNALTLNSRPYTILGIMPAVMRYPSRLTDVWLPLGAYVSTFPTDRGVHPGLTAVGRLKPGVSVDAARAEMDTVARRLSVAFPNSNQNTGIVISPYEELVFENIRPAYRLLLGAVAMVLLIGCANLASLMLAHTEARQHELAVRAALGAGHWRIVTELVGEAVLLSMAGGALGVGLAMWVVRAFVSTSPAIVPRVDLIRVDWRVLAVAATVSVGTGLLFGLAPALRGSRDALHGAMKDGARQTGRGITTWRSVLVGGEVALSTMLLVAAGLFARSFAHVAGTELGFDPTHVITMRLTLPTPKYPTLDSWLTFHRNVLERLAATPGIERAGLSSAVPLEGGGSESFIIKEGDPMPTPQHPPAMCSFQTASAGYLEAMGIRLVRGRFINDRDVDLAPRVVVVDDALAVKFFPNEDPIGKHVAFESRGHTQADVQPIFRQIVGVVHHVVHYGLTGEPPYLQVFVPYSQLPTYLVDRRPTLAIAVRTSADPDAALSSVRSAVSAVDPDVPVYDAKTMSTYLRQASEQPRLSLTVLGGFAGLALLLAVVGVAGVLSYAVSLRTREIGVRVALGARPGEIVRLVARQAAVMVGGGLMVGVGGALALTRVIAAQLYNVSPTDAATFAAVIAVLTLAAGLAAVVPARRAATVDPLVALKTD